MKFGPTDLCSFCSVAGRGIGGVHREQLPEVPLRRPPRLRRRHKLNKANQLPPPPKPRTQAEEAMENNPDQRQTPKESLEPLGTSPSLRCRKNMKASPCSSIGEIIGEAEANPGCQRSRHDHCAKMPSHPEFPVGNKGTEKREKRRAKMVPLGFSLAYD